jgi:membrane associated rhomboid family serine protease
LSDEKKHQENQPSGGRQPVFLFPGVITALLGLLIAVHLAASLLDPLGQALLIYWFAFVPSRVDLLPLVWTPFTHALLHAGWEHLLINSAWLAIFGTPVARRYGPIPTIAIFMISAAAGAGAFVLTSPFSTAFLIGASGGVAGLTGAAMRFIFQPVLVARDPETGDPVVLGRRLASFGEMMRNPRSRWFTIIWVGLNAAVPLLPLFGRADVAIAWQAHLGGFAAGLLLVPLFERRG